MRVNPLLTSIPEPRNAGSSIAETDVALPAGLNTERNSEREGNSETKEMAVSPEAEPRMPQVFDRQIRFELNRETGRIVARIINRETGELIRQVPPEQILNLVKAVRSFLGLLVDRTF